MKKITLIIGLPCSGKTTLLNTLSGYNIDDISDLNQLPDFFDINLNICSPHFIFNNVRNAAIKILQNKYTNIEIELIFFENNKEKCLKNMLKRNDFKIKKVENFINNYSKEYKIPENAKVIKINE